MGGKEQEVAKGDAQHRPLADAAADITALRPV